MRFRILGPLEVVDGDRRVPVGGPKRPALLAALLVDANSVVSTRRLAEALWPDRAPTDENHALHTQISRLRSLVDAAPDPGEEGRLVNYGHGYLLRVAEDELDALAFEALQRVSETALEAGDWQGAIDRADDALACWRGPALEEFSDTEWAAPRVAQLEELRLRTAECRIGASLALGRHREVVGDLEEAVANNPLRERLWHQLMLALYRSDRQSEALRAFQRVRTLLGDELGISPGAELVRLEQAILDQDPHLDWRPAPAPAPTIPAGEARSQREATFLFTDVENSTALWDRDPTAMATALGDHDDVVRTTSDAHGGEVVARPGDGFCVVFDRAADAVASALDAQRQLQKVASSGSAQLRVRMAIHTGDAEVRNGNYSGTNINRISRLRDAAHGGQILVSEASRGLLADRPPSGATLVDVGRWSFEGLSRSERVFQLAHPDLEAGFPPLRSGRHRTGQVPRHSTSFVGRQTETEQVMTALGKCPLITITGEGGIGKTRLTLEVVHRVNPADFPDGIWFCDLSAVHDAAGLIEVMMAAIGLAPPAGSDARAAVVSALQGSRLLLLVDNCEQVVPAVAEVVNEILVGGPTARILATSRAPLRVPGEQVIDLSPLDLLGDPDTDDIPTPALQLLLDRTLASGTQLDAEDPALVDIVRQLDGVPLAIELAAPRLASMSPRDLAARLHRDSDLLSGPATIPARQRTLRATIDWSFRLLTPEAQRLLGALSVFRGGWTLESAEAIASAVDLDTDDVALLIAELSDHSMIRIDQPIEGAVRYRMLETMRAYAADHLASTENGDTVAEHHAGHFIATVETAASHRRGPMEPAWVRELDIEIDNIRAAFRWSIAAQRPEEGLRIVSALAEDIMRERLEIGRWALEVLELPGAERAPRRAVALAVAGHVAMLEYRADDAVRLSHAAVEAEESVTVQSWISRTTLALLTGLGFIEGDFRHHLDAMAAISQLSGDPLPAAVADFNRALLAWGSGSPEKGLHSADRLLAVAAEHQNPTLFAMGLLAHGRAVAADDPETAARDYHDALAAAATAHNRVLAQHALRAIQELKSVSGDRTGALLALQKVAASFERSGNVTEQLHTVVSMLDTLVAVGAWEVLATVCGALSQTPWRLTPASGLLERTAAEELGRVDYRAARRAGTLMRPEQLVSFLSAAIRALTDATGSDGSDRHG